MNHARRQQYRRLSRAGAAGAGAVAALGLALALAILGDRAVERFDVSVGLWSASVDASVLGTEGGHCVGEDGRWISLPLSVRT